MSEKTVYDFVKNHICKTECVENTLYGTVGKGKRCGVQILNYHKYNYLTEPIFEVTLSEVPNEEIDLTKILSKVELHLGGTCIDQLYADEIVVYQHKYNITPTQVGNKLLIPLPFNCMLKTNGLIYNGKGYYDLRMFIEVSDYSMNQYIEDGCLMISQSKLDDHFDMSEMSNYFYNGMVASRAQQDRILKINNSHPTDFQSYYVIYHLLNSMGSSFEKANLPNIKQELVEKNSDHSSVNTDVHTNTSSKKYNLNSLNVLVGLVNYTKNRNLGLEVVDVNSSSKKVRLAYNHDVKSMYIMLKQSSTIYTSKWFNNCTIQVNGHDKLIYSYEMLVHLNKRNNLPPGVLSIPNVDKLDLHEEVVTIIFSGVKNRDVEIENTKEYAISIFAEISDWMTIGDISSLVFG